VAWGWASAPSLLIFAVGAVALVAFCLLERRAAEPILPLWVFRHRVLIGGNLTAVAVGAVLIGLSSYVPTYAEGVLGTSALVAGFALAALTVGWPISGSQAGRVYLRIGFRDTALIGSVVVVFGTLLCVTLGEDAKLWQVAGACFVIGVGLGFTASPTLVAVQSVVGWEHRGVVTGTNMFGRSLGSAVGAAVFGAIANGTLASRFAHPPAALAGRLGKNVDAASLVSAGRGGAKDAATAAYVRASLSHATHNVFLTLVVLAVLGVTAVALMPRRAEPLRLD
jgi:MFS family permease